MKTYKLSEVQKQYPQISDSYISDSGIVSDIDLRSIFSDDEIDEVALKAIIESFNNPTQIQKETLIKKDKTDKAFNKISQSTDKEASLAKIDLTLPTASKEERIAKIKSLRLLKANPLPIINDYISKRLLVGPGEFICFVAEAKGGKTSLANSIVKSLVDGDKKILYISNEESASAIITKLAYTYVSKYATIETIADQECELDSKILLAGVGVHQDLDMTDVKDIKFIIEKYKNDVDIIVFDYLSKVVKDSDTGETSHEAMKSISSYLSQVMITTPVIAFSQIKLKGIAKDDGVAQKVQGTGSLPQLVTKLIELKKQDFGFSTLSISYERNQNSDTQEDSELNLTYNPQTGLLDHLSSTDYQQQLTIKQLEGLNDD